jgi:hypothetical protein
LLAFTALLELARKEKREGERSSFRPGVLFVWLRRKFDFCIFVIDIFCLIIGEGLIENKCVSGKSVCIISITDTDAAY